MITMNDNTGVISTTSSTMSGTYTLTLRNTGSYNITTFSLTISGSTPVPCLTEESKVLTENGYIDIGDLKIGDVVITSDDRKVKIQNIYYSELEGNLETYPCIVSKDSLGDNLPEKEFRISQGHLIRKGDNWIVPKEHFELDTSIERIKYYHIRLENYVSDHLVINNGVVVESLGKGLFDAIEYYKRQGKNYCIIVKK